jgi:hypothetical protein
VVPSTLARFETARSHTLCDLSPVDNRANGLSLSVRLVHDCGVLAPGTMNGWNLGDSIGSGWERRSAARRSQVVDDEAAVGVIGSAATVQLTMESESVTSLVL